MTKTELEQYCKLKKEVKTLMWRLDKLQGKDVPVVAGKVQSSDSDFPFLPLRVSVEMHDPAINSKVKETVTLLQTRLKKCTEQMLRTEEFIDDIPDSELRQIFELRYIDGMKLRDISKELNQDLSGIGKKITAYLQVSNNSKKSML